MMKITPGATIFGASGKALIVDRVEGDIIYSGELKILASAVVRVIPKITAFKVGDRVQYVGSNFNLKTQYVGVLEVWSIAKNPFDGYTCLKSDGRLTSWIQFEDLQSAFGF